MGGGALLFAFYTLSQSALLFSMNEIVASVMVLFSTTFNYMLRNRSKSQSAFASNSFVSKLGILSWRKKSVRIRSNWFQCWRKCLLSSMPLPQIKDRLLQSKLCLNLRSFNVLIFTPSFDNFFDTLYIKDIVKRIFSWSYNCKKFPL